MARGTRRVVAAGTFDGLHEGHRYYLSVAKNYGEHLTVIVARDATVRLVKGKSPRYGEQHRLACVSAVPGVDRTLLGRKVPSAEPEDRFRLLLRLRPDVVCLGYDQPVRVRDLRSFLDVHGLKRARIVRARKAPHS